MAGRGEVCGVSEGPGCFSATEIQDILENPSIRQLFVVAQGHKQVFPVFLCEIILYNVQQFPLGLQAQ
jgi:hypothetical protein